jgi:geranylgeranyl pyrophosphate synthase
MAIRGKTAALLSASCRIGGICAGLRSDQVAELSQYGEQLGLAFQLIDDVLDFIADFEKFGKHTGIDIQEGVYTMPVLISLHDKKNSALRALLQEVDKDNPADITDILIKDGAIQQTLQEADNYCRQAGLALKSFEPEQSKGLVSLPKKYKQWALSELVQTQYRHLAA